MTSSHKLAQNLTDRPANPTIIRVLRNADDRTYLREWRFSTIGGGVGSARLPRSLSPLETVRKLGDQGAVYGGPASEVIADAIRSEPQSVLDITRQTGWFGDGTNCYVTPSWTEGNVPGPRYLKAADDHCPNTGSGNRWRGSLIAPCGTSTLLPFAVGIAFAAPLLRPLGETGAVFNFFGPSSSGKTAAVRAAQSVWRRAGLGDLETLGSSDRAVEELCGSHSDCVLVLDEDGRREGNEAKRAAQRRKLAFLVDSGRGNRLSRVVTSTLPTELFRTIVITTSEKPSEREVGGDRSDGERARFIDIPIGDHGLFDRPGESESTDHFASLYAGIDANHGRAGRRFIAHLLKDPEAASKAQSAFDTFLKDMAAQDGLERRFASKFAIIEAGMVLAAQYGIAPWEAGGVRDITAAVYQRARSQFAGTRVAADELLAQVIIAQRDGHMPEIKKGEAPPAGSWGFVRRDPTYGAILALDPSRLNALVPEGARQNALLDDLHGRGLMIRKTDRKRNVQLKCGTQRSRYCVFKL